MKMDNELLYVKERLNTYGIELIFRDSNSSKINLDDIMTQGYAPMFYDVKFARSLEGLIHYALDNRIRTVIYDQVSFNMQTFKEQLREICSEDILRISYEEELERMMSVGEIYNDTLYEEAFEHVARELNSAIEEMVDEIEFVDGMPINYIFNAYKCELECTFTVENKEYSELEKCFTNLYDEYEKKLFRIINRRFSLESKLLRNN